MEQIYEERKIKIDRILEEYSKRKSQNTIAEMFNMSQKHVSWVTQQNNYSHTLDLTQCNPNNKMINSIIFYKDFEYLDKYPIENFIK
ncbi:MAG: hypothetical protein ACLVCT_02875 [Lachnospira sp.]